MAMTALAPAKLNLALAVGPPDGRGMHPICSWMVTISLCDLLFITRLPEDQSSRYAIAWHPDAPRPNQIYWPTKSDLAVRAHLAIQEHLGPRMPLAGFFANGEIGPVGERSFLHGFTASIALLRRRSG